MRKYKVETRHDTSKAWDGVMTVSPDYVVTITKVYKFFFFCPREIGVIANLRVAEKAAALKAVTFAKAMYHATPCRVMVQKDENGVRSTDVLWQNGSAIREEGHSLLHLLFGWLH